jgi:DNA-directed RNA polymerase subunit E'/Rpb7
MVSNITHQEILQHKISIPSNQISKDMDALILTKLQQNIGDRCLSNGFIDKDSIRVLRRSLGKFDAERLKGEFIYHVEYMCNITLPTEGCVLKGVATLKNKMGVSVYVGDKKQIRILLSKDFHAGDDDFSNINIGDKITCTVIAADFQAGSKYIECIGQLGDHGDEYNDVSESDSDDDSAADDEAESDDDGATDNEAELDDDGDDEAETDGEDESESDGEDESESDGENENDDKKSNKSNRRNVNILGGEEEGKSMSDDDE